VEGRDGRQAEGTDEVEDRVTIVAAVDRGVVLDGDDVGTRLERAGGSRIVGALVTTDPVMDLEGVRGDWLDGMERDDLAVRRDPAQGAGEGRDPALPRRVGGDEGGTNDGWLRSAR
jgi:hypothetical protein